MPSSDAAKFALVENSYRTLREKMLLDAEQMSTQSNASTLNNDVDVSEKDFGIKHTAPQHRQYLSYEGVGYGTVSQRQRQYQSFRVDRAVDSVREHRTAKLASQTSESSQLVYMDKKKAQSHKMRNAIDRLVEDLDNLSGKGKPLSHSAHNPYIDSVTQKLNEVLINNGYTPEWILLEKEIREEASTLRRKLKSLQPPLNGSKERCEWTERTNALRPQVQDLNRKIDKYNLLVPILEKQRVHFVLDREMRKVLIDGGGAASTNLDDHHHHRRSRPTDQSSNRDAHHDANNGGLLLTLFSILFRT